MKNIRSLYNITEVELTYRRRSQASDSIKVSEALDAAIIFRASWNKRNIQLLEQFKILLLAQDNRCLGISTVAVGGISGCHVDPRIIFSLALKAKSSAIILCHNHPSGNLKPSQPDVAITHRLAEAGGVIGIDVLDHIILTKDSFFSFTENGLLSTRKLAPV